MTQPEVPPPLFRGSVRLKALTAGEQSQHEKEVLDILTISRSRIRDWPHRPLELATFWRSDGVFWADAIKGS